MLSGTTKKIGIALAAIIVLTTCIVDAGAQRRRRKRRRAPSTPVITNPAITAPSPAPEGDGNDNQSAEPKPGEDPDSMRQTIRTLSNQVDRLNDKIDNMEKSQRSLADLERLTLAEQRAESLRSQLSDVLTKEGEVQARLENIDNALLPQNIDRYVGGIGTTHPEDARDQRRKQLESEKMRARTQLDTLMQNHSRLEASVAAADVEVDKIRKRLDAADEAAIENAKKKGGTGSPQPYASPTPTPYP